MLNETMPNIFDNAKMCYATYEQVCHYRCCINNKPLIDEQHYHRQNQRNAEPYHRIFKAHVEPDIFTGYFYRHMKGMHFYSFGRLKF